LAKQCRVCGGDTPYRDNDSSDDRCDECIERDEVASNPNAPDEFKEGRLAALAGMPKIMNPYRVPGVFPGTDEYLWRIGYEYQVEHG
jgi:hypothetical protein